MKTAAEGGKKGQETHSFRQDFYYLGKGLKLIHQMEPGLIFFGAMLSVWRALKPFVNIYMTAQIINELLGDMNVKRLALYVFLMISLNFILSLEVLLSSRRDVHILSMSRKQGMMMSEKIMTMDYQNAEDAKVHLLYRQVEDRCMMMGRELWGVAEKMENLVRCAVTLIMSVGLALPLFFTTGSAQETRLAAFISSPVFSFCMAAVVIVTSVFSVVMSIKQNDGELEISKDDAYSFQSRVYDFYEGYLIDYKTGKDVRLYRQENLIMKEIEKAVSNMKGLAVKLGRMRGKYTALRSVLSVGVAGLVYLFVGLKALVGLVPVGNIVQYTGSITQFIEGLSLLMKEMTDLRMASEDFRLFFEFLEYPNSQEKNDGPVSSSGQHEVVFQHVSFCYPGTDTPVLKDVNLTIRKGTRLAVVGMNGSGKTTMIKLLCRLYDPTEGRILLDGKDIRQYDYEEYQRLFAVVFQDFKLFALPIGENIAAGETWEEEKARRALEEAGLWERVSRMPQGTKTPIYKECYEDGVEISGGEAQKLAIARALYRDAPFVILDEPTAALDPVSEYEIYARFDSMIKDKTAVYISHRLSSCRFCEDIAVFDKGRIVQRGSHESLLMDKEGKYFELWNAQAQYYAE